MTTSLRQTWEFICPIHGTVTTYVKKQCMQCNRDRQLKHEVILQQHLWKDRKYKSHIPTKFFNVTFQNFYCSNEELLHNKDIIEKWNYKGNLFLFGKTGTGKTHLAISCLNNFLQHFNHGYYVKFYNLPNIYIQDKNFYYQLLTSKLLIIDEIGVTSTQYKIELIAELIDQRYDKELPTIFITNYNITYTRKFFPDRTLSRIREACQELHFNGEDYRENIKLMLNH